VEKKLLVVEENDETTLNQYKILKKYSGQKNALVHKKFRDPYKVRNNMNIIILTNQDIPIYVKKEEMPKDENNNQFFVYEFKKLKNKIDNTLYSTIVNGM
jgi:hypothetical protein